MKIIGIDLGAPEDDKTVIAQYHEGQCRTVELPEILGRITDFREQKGKVVVDTESGVPVIIPGRMF